MSEIYKSLNEMYENKLLILGTKLMLCQDDDSNIIGLI